MIFLNADSLSHVNSSSAVDIIKAISGLWPVMLILAIFSLIIIFHKKIGLYLNRFNKLSGKFSNTEVQLENTLGIERVSDKTISETLKEEITPKDTIEVKLPDISDTNDDIITVYRKISENKLQEAEEVFNRMLQLETDNKDKELNTIWYKSYLYVKGKSYSYNDIEAIADSSIYKENRYEGYSSIGWSSSSLGQLDISRRYYEKAIEFAMKDEHKADALINISEIISKQQNTQESITYLMENINSIESEDGKSKMYVQIGEYYEAEGRHIEKCLAYQMALVYKPNDTGLLFKVAYNFSAEKVDFQTISLHNYRIAAVVNTKDGYSLNNLGVLYGKLKLPHMSIKYFRRSFENNISLAGSNIANLYIDNGFLDEAEEILQKAKLFSDISPNVWQSLKLLDEKKESEINEEKKYLAMAEKDQIYMNLFTTAYFSNFNKLVETKGILWEINGTKIDVASTEFNIEIKFTQELEEYIIRYPLKHGMALITKGSKKIFSNQEDVTVYIYFNDELNKMNILIYRKEILSKLFYFNAISEVE